MSDVMSFAEVHDQLAELLPARTVLSTLPVPDVPIVGAQGEAGQPGASGSGLLDSALNTPRFIGGITESSGKVS